MCPKPATAKDDKYKREALARQTQLDRLEKNTWNAYYNDVNNK